jgi:DNA invertase Pin-like site-specific DNA recombinase
MRVARYGYARVSTRSQTDDSQLDALTAAGCERIWTDTASGKLARRPEWDKCLDYLRAGDGAVNLVACLVTERIAGLLAGGGRSWAGGGQGAVVPGVSLPG